MSKIADTEANATSLDSLVNDNALVPTLRNGPKPSYQYLVDGWTGEVDNLLERTAGVGSENAYETTAAGLAATVNGDYFSVVSQDDSTYLELYKNDSGSAVFKKSYPSADFVYEVGYLKPYNYPDFVPPSGAIPDSLTSNYSGRPIGNLYQSLRNVKLYGFDKEKNVTIQYILNSLPSDEGPFFRLILTEQASSGTYLRKFDNGYGRLMSEYGFTEDGTHIYDETIGGQRVVAEINFSLIPIRSSLGNPIYSANTPPLVFSKDSFYESEDGDMFYDKTIFYPNFVPYKLNDYSTLKNAYLTGYRNEVYQSIKSVKLYGFDPLKPTWINMIQNSDTIPGTPCFRIGITQEGETSPSQSSFNNGYGRTMAEYGFTSDGVYVYDETINGKRVVMEIDFSLIPTSTNGPYFVGNNGSTGTPELVFKRDVFNVEGEVIPDITDLMVTESYKRGNFKRKQKAVFCFQWDDLRSSDSNVFNVFKEYGFLPNFAITSNNMNDNNAGFYQQAWLEGCSILAHSVNHPSMISDSMSLEDAEYQMRESKRVIESYGIKVSGWVTPSSSLNDKYIGLVEKYFSYGATQSKDTQTAFDKTIDPVRLSRYSVESPGISGNGVADIKSRIDTAIAGSELVVFYGHQIPSNYENPEGGSAFTESDLREVLAYLKSKGEDGSCLVLPSDEAIEMYYKESYIN